MECRTKANGMHLLVENAIEWFWKVSNKSGRILISNGLQLCVQPALKTHGHLVKLEKHAEHSVSYIELVNEHFNSENSSLSISLAKIFGKSVRKRKKNQQNWNHTQERRENKDEKKIALRWNQTHREPSEENQNGCVLRFFLRSSFSLNKMYYTPEIQLLNGNVYFASKTTYTTSRSWEQKKGTIQFTNYWEKVAFSIECEKSIEFSVKVNLLFKGKRKGTKRTGSNKVVIFIGECCKKLSSSCTAKENVFLRKVLVLFFFLSFLFARCSHRAFSQIECFMIPHERKVLAMLRKLRFQAPFDPILI